MTFRDIRFPTGVRYGSTMGPEFSTSLSRAISGRTFRNKNWQYPLRRFQVDRALRDDALRADIIRFFYNVNGAGDTFRIKDWSDFTVGLTDSPATGVFVALGASQFQLIARYTSAGYTKDIPIYLPRSGTLTLNGGALVQGVHWSTDYTVPSGVITTLGSPTPIPSSWTGEYDVHARFENDYLPMTAEDEDLYFANSLAIIEERSTS